MPTLRHTKSEEHLDVVVDEDDKKPIHHTNSDVNKYWQEYGISDDDAWLPEDDEITAQYLNMHKISDRDTVSQMSLDSIDSREQSKYFLVNQICT